MTKNIKWGIIIIAVGVLLLMNNLGIIATFATYWPVLVILVGILMLFDKDKSANQSNETSKQ